MKYYILTMFLLLQMLFSEPFEGLTLITSMGGGQNSSDTYLIDNDENIINSWSHSTGSASVGYLSRDSILFLPSKLGGNGDGPAGGLFKKIDWDGNIIWEWMMPVEICVPHHDITILPNENILAICEETKTQEEALNAGLQGINGSMTLDMVVEIQPIGNNQANIVWEWHFWDHLVQDRGLQYTATYGEISDYPELLDINVNGNGNNQGINDWNHSNKISYNENFDQIVLSCRHMNEIYVIDHSTTTEEAADHTGGNQGKGGDLLYRWGNPQNYDRGNNSDQILNAQHGINWISDGYPGEGNFLVYNNRHQTQPNRSAVLEFDCIADENGSYSIEDGEPFGPETYLWIYQADFFSNTQSGAYRLPNGNTLITVTNENDIFEVDLNGVLQWHPGFDIQCARALKYGFDYFENDLLGDINSDNQVNILDVIVLVNIILEGAFDNLGDINDDGILNVLDIIDLINIILN